METAKPHNYRIMLCRNMRLGCFFIWSGLKNFFICLITKRELFAFEMQWATWGPHISLLSKIMPKKFIVFWVLIALPWSLMVVNGLLLRWNRHTSVLVSLTWRPVSLSNLTWIFPIKRKRNLVNLCQGSKIKLCIHEF
jgi:hypothetical protein